MSNPDKNALRNYQFQQALNSNNNEEQRKDSSLLLIQGIEQTKKQIQKSLLGYHYQKVKDQNGELKLKKIEHHLGSKLCNEKAVADFMASIDGTVNVNTLGSNLSDKNISDLGEDCMLSITEKITLKHDEYGIESTSDANQIISIISTNVMAALRKARNARFLRHDEETRQVKTIETVTDEDKKRGFL